MSAFFCCSMWPDNPYLPENQEEAQHAYPSGQFGVQPGPSHPLYQNRASAGMDEEYDDENYE